MTSKFQLIETFLAAASPFFYTLLLSVFDDSKRDKIHIKDVSGQILQELVEYLYTSKIPPITEDNIQNILGAADMLQLDGVIERCDDFLKMKLKSSNCLFTYALADRYRPYELKESALTLIKKEFAALTLSEDCLALSSEHLTNIISSENVVVSEEQIV